VPADGSPRNRFFRKVCVTTSIDRQIAKELALRIDDVATVPFIARYRKEVTGAVDDAQLGALDERLRYLREERRAMILNSIREPGKRRASSTPKSSSPMRPPRSTALVRSWSNAK
jgi:transcriptional accessory protein Tex/SPT6